MLQETFEYYKYATPPFTLSQVLDQPGSNAVMEYYLLSSACMKYAEFHENVMVTLKARGRNTHSAVECSLLLLSSLLFVGNTEADDLLDDCATRRPDQFISDSFFRMFHDGLKQVFIDTEPTNGEAREESDKTFLLSENIPAGLLIELARNVSEGTHISIDVFCRYCSGLSLQHLYQEGNLDPFYRARTALADWQAATIRKSLIDLTAANKKTDSFMKIYFTPGTFAEFLSIDRGIQSNFINCQLLLLEFADLITKNEREEIVSLLDQAIPQMLDDLYDLQADISGSHLSPKSPLHLLKAKGELARQWIAGGKTALENEPFSSLKQVYMDNRMISVEMSAEEQLKIILTNTGQESDFDLLCLAEKRTTEYQLLDAMITASFSPQHNKEAIKAIMSLVKESGIAEAIIHLSESFLHKEETRRLAATNPILKIYLHTLIQKKLQLCKDMYQASSPIRHASDIMSFQPPVLPHTNSVKISKRNPIETLIFLRSGTLKMEYRDEPALARLYQEYQSLSKDIARLYGEAAFWHGTGKFKLDVQTRHPTDVLSGIAKEGIIPHPDVWVYQDGKPLVSTSLANSRMYARVYAQMHEAEGSNLQYLFGSRYFWASFFYDGMVLPYLKNFFRSEVLTVLNSSVRNKYMDINQKWIRSIRHDAETVRMSIRD
ncbi:hypothetical protein MUP32_06295, partial [Candidatus Microgenomates bacterium]|nr:hypothetical protein [Candidatus Microgenomates bacterium]